MADVQNGGRIVPIVATPRQLSRSSTDDSLSKPLQSPSEPHPEAQAQVQAQVQAQPPSEDMKSNRKSRSKTTEAESLELACLKELDLYALPTEGDGNCLYYALSDQEYGEFTHADDIRIRLADHIAANKGYFMSFVSASGGERRAPRRAAAVAAAAMYTSSSSSASPAPPSDQDKERTFDTKVAESRKKGVWGGAQEIQAFCQSFKKDVKVYTMYGIQTFRDVHAPQDEVREVVHIAYHEFQHYSSVRNVKGPHQGLPCVLKADEVAEKAASTTPTTVDVATPWKISAIQEGLGGKFDQDTIVEMLQQCRGNIDRAFMNLLGDGTGTSLADAPASKAIMKSRLQPSSRSSSPFSTGSKRSADESDSEENPRPAVRRTRVRETKRRILPDVTVGIAFRDDQNDLVSLRLRVSPDTGVQRPSVRPTAEQTEGGSPASAPEPSSAADSPARDRKLRLRSKAASAEASIPAGESSIDPKPPRRSKRLSRTRPA
ncbi:hypothetical protein BO70DRAFT_289623 [Aspergillus heteromorphus CBS 117.55]|uniref:OTU domain-containing protein n=1 Tax=Aspergillus heteromorphus CBS 117.55 TaxID=1448321 RepID=A0A317WEP0_9EURO|nr:uncharacterized protein BO70DRAFT_289623 [Aspergillus heteromorphus CBS 117.55]PWY84863.1 hypothetical protein BO70DRAFT_289623 [Aspergillus heteromorphus CBS 117.55]